MCGVQTEAKSHRNTHTLSAGLHLNLQDIGSAETHTTSCSEDQRSHSGSEQGFITPELQMQPVKNATEIEKQRLSFHHWTKHTASGGDAPVPPVCSTALAEMGSPPSSDNTVPSLALGSPSPRPPPDWS